MAIVSMKNKATPEWTNSWVCLSAQLVIKTKKLKRSVIFFMNSGFNFSLG